MTTNLALQDVLKAITNTREIDKPMRPTKEPNISKSVKQRVTRMNQRRRKKQTLFKMAVFL